MDTTEFVSRLHTMSPDEMRAVATALRNAVQTAEGEVSWWRATVAISAALRQQRRSREAGALAHQASAAVLDAASRAGVLDAEHATVTLVARAAAEVARGLAAGPTVRPEVDSLLLAWAA